MALTDGPPGAIRGGFHFAAGETMVQKEPRLLLLKRSGLPRLTALRRFEDCGRLGENNLATNAAGWEAVSQGQFVHLNGGKGPKANLGAFPGVIVGVAAHKAAGDRRTPVRMLPQQLWNVDRWIQGRPDSKAVAGRSH
jgi:hypothetical protein